MTGIISIVGLNKVYDSGHKALTDINLDIQKGEIFALLGPNGAGKTTLINTVCGIVTPTSGEILACLLYTSPSPRDQRGARMPSSA